VKVWLGTDFSLAYKNENLSHLYTQSLVVATFNYYLLKPTIHIFAALSMPCFE